jgi:U3 small nucleolar RNA-associated protein 4
VSAIALGNDQQLAAAYKSGWIRVNQWKVQVAQSVTRLIWLDQQLLIAVGLGGQVCLYDINYLQPRKTEDSYGGAVWNAAASPCKTQLCLACQDGSIRFFGLPDLGYQIHIQAHKNGILCVAYSPHGSKIASAGIDGVVQIWELGNARAILKITLERRKRKEKSTEDDPTLTQKEEIPSIWSMVWLNSGELVTGDSFGNVQFWDTNTGTLINQFSELQAPVLALASSTDHKYVFASGVNPLCLVFESIDSKSWVITGRKRIHNLDTLNIACTRLDESGKETIISGSMSGEIKFFEVGSSETRELSFKKVVAPIVYNNIESAPKGNAIMAVGNKLIQVWKLGRPKKNFPSSKSEDSKSKSKKRQVTSQSLEVEDEPICVVDLDVKEVIQASSLTRDGSAFAYSTLDKLVVSRLNFDQGSFSFETISESLKPCQALAWTSTNTLVGVGLDSIIYFYNPLESEFSGEKSQESVDLNKVFDLAPLTSQLRIHKNDKWLALLKSSNQIVFVDLTKRKHHGSTFITESPIVCMSFHPKENLIVFVCSSNEFYLYNVETLSLTELSSQYGKTLLSVAKSQILHASFDPVNTDHLLFQTASQLIRLDLSEPPAPRKVFRKKSLPANLQIMDRYKDISYSGFLESGELVLLELPESDLCVHLPSGMYRHAYGT